MFHVDDTAEKETDKEGDFPFNGYFEVVLYLIINS